jgi:hypothetical protein
MCIRKHLGTVHSRRCEMHLGYCKRTGNDATNYKLDLTNTKRSHFVSHWRMHFVLLSVRANILGVYLEQISIKYIRLRLSDPDSFGNVLSNTVE